MQVASYREVVRAYDRMKSAPRSRLRIYTPDIAYGQHQDQT
jgi:hypothetical protein